MIFYLDTPVKPEYDKEEGTEYDIKQRAEGKVNSLCVMVNFA